MGPAPGGIHDVHACHHEPLGQPAQAAMGMPVAGGAGGGRAYAFCGYSLRQSGGKWHSRLCQVGRLHWECQSLTSWVLLVGSANNLPAIQDPVLHSFFWAQLTCAVLGSLPSWTWQTLCSLETYASFTSETYAQAGLSGLGMLLN